MEIPDNRPDRTGRGAFSYPGTWRQYLGQAMFSTGVLAGVLLVLLAVVMTVDRCVLRGTGLGAVHLLLLGAVVVAYAVISLLMARSLVRFNAQVTETGVIIRRAGTDLVIPFGEIRSVARSRIPGWWPLRADLKPRGQSARHMVRIFRRSGPSMTFIGGLDGEEELLAVIEEKRTKN